MKVFVVNCTRLVYTLLSICFPRSSKKITLRKLLWWHSCVLQWLWWVFRCNLDTINNSFQKNKVPQISKHKSGLLGRWITCLSSGRYISANFNSARVYNSHRANNVKKPAHELLLQWRQWTFNVFHSLALSFALFINLENFHTFRLVLLPKISSYLEIHFQEQRIFLLCTYFLREIDGILNEATGSPSEMTILKPSNSLVAVTLLSNKSGVIQSLNW